MSWDFTRELYLKWLDDNSLKKFFDNELKYDGISLWWETKLNQRDNISDPSWYKNLNYLLNNRNAHELVNTKKKFKNHYIILLKDLFKHLLVLAYSKTRKNTFDFKNKIWFNIMDYNLVNLEDTLVDRNYLNTPLSDINFRFNTIYLLRTFISLKDITNRILRKKYNAFKKLKRPYYIIDEFITFSDLINVYLHIYLCEKKIKKHLQKVQNPFLINNVDCSSILENQLLESFHGPIQTSLTYAISIKNVFKNQEPNQIFVCYNELLPESRFVYAYLKEMNNKSISIQHSYNSENKLFGNYKSFKNKFTESPIPEYFYVQGLQYKKVLSSFYDEKFIKEIGVLKYDSNNYCNNFSNELRISIYSNIKKDLRKILLVVFSIDDEERILNILSDFDNMKEWRIIVSPHPVTISKTLELCNKFLGKLSYEYYSELNTVQLISAADIVLGGYSATILEALIFNKPSVCVPGIDDIPYLDNDSGIQICRNKEDLNYILKNFNQILTNYNPKNIIKYHFGSIDGEAYKRFWNFTQSITYDH